MTRNTQKTHTQAQPEQPIIPLEDPYIKYNKSAFNFNTKMDEYIMRPVAGFYNDVMPRPLNLGFDNFFRNLGNVSDVVNDVLQANFYQASSDTWRLGVNSTAGIGGLFDVGTRIGLYDNPENFGLTLAKWGWVNSNYFIVPFMGPATVRDAVSLPVDYMISPYPYITTRFIPWGLVILRFIDKRAQLLHFQKVYDEMALDPYELMKSLYYQKRNYEIQRNNELSDPYTPKEEKKLESDEDDYYLDE